MTGLLIPSVLNSHVRVALHLPPERLSEAAFAQVNRIVNRTERSRILPMRNRRQIQLLALWALVASHAFGQSNDVPTQIRPPIDETHRAVLRGNTHPSARAEYDLGTAPADLPMKRMDPGQYRSNKKSWFQ
jgi:hypothetical protein